MTAARRGRGSRSVNRRRNRRPIYPTRRYRSPSAPNERARHHASARGAATRIRRRCEYRPSFKPCMSRATVPRRTPPRVSSRFPILFEALSRQTSAEARRRPTGAPAAQTIAPPRIGAGEAVFEVDRFATITADDAPLTCSRGPPGAGAFTRRVGRPARALKGSRTAVTAGRGGGNPRACAHGPRRTGGRGIGALLLLAGPFALGPAGAKN